MKKILITGANSYIGTQVENWLNKQPNNYQVDTIDMQDSSWKEKDFSGYDVVFHVAGIAHVSKDPTQKELYYRVNRDLTISAAQKAKAEGVKQFIFMSSIIVYGKAGKDGIITKETLPLPIDFYGDSKLQAENGIMPLGNDDFKVVIIRPPMIYGKGSKGNYPRLAKVACKLPFFPNIENQRSMLHVDNLSEFIKVMIDNHEHGLFFPQNNEVVKTSDLVREIAAVHGKKIHLTRVFNLPLKLLIPKINLINKVFGNLVYEKSISKYKVNYQIRDLRESVELTEGSDREE